MKRFLCLLYSSMLYYIFISGILMLVCGFLVIHCPYTDASIYVLYLYLVFIVNSVEKYLYFES